MRKIIKLPILFGVLVTMWAPYLTVRAQQLKNVLPAPVPSQIYTGKKVFVSNAGGDINHLYSGEPQRLYNQFYACLKSWGRYDLVGNPAEADLVLEISFINPFIGEYIRGGGGQTSPFNRSASDPQFRAAII